MSRAPSLAIVDYGMGNRRSVEKALQHVGADATITSEHAAIATADGLVVPGVGAFPAAMARLDALGLSDLIRARFAAGVPVLGICLGLQLAFESSTELGGARGLGLVPGRVTELEAPGLKLPHIGWSTVAWQRASPLTEGLPDPCAFYHVHTFGPEPADHADVLGIADYGPPFVTAVARANFYGVQFHPEKSSAHGLRLLSNFSSICARSASAIAA